MRNYAEGGFKVIRALRYEGVFRALARANGKRVLNFHLEVTAVPDWTQLVQWETQRVFHQSRLVLQEVQTVQQKGTGEGNVFNGGTETLAKR